MRMTGGRLLRLLVGTYSEPILFGTGERFCGKGKGIYLCTFDGADIRTEGLLPLANPSFLTVDEAAGRIYAVNETKEFQGVYGGGVTEITLTADGEMQVVAAHPTGGTDPCHIALSPDKSRLGIANFADGSVSFFRLDGAGRITGEMQHIQHHGSSVHPVRQKGPHAHSVIFDGDGHALVPDLGMDRLVCYDIQGADAQPDPAHTVTVSPGNGPRFGEFSPDRKHFYLINELASSVTHFTCHQGEMRECETVSTLPEDFAGENICSDLHIAPDGRTLYASNRGHDSLTVFCVGADGGLTLMQRVSCHGRTPRNFALTPDGTALLVGNQDSDTIAVFGVTQDGGLSFRRCVDFPTPVCIRFLRG